MLKFVLVVVVIVVVLAWVMRRPPPRVDERRPKGGPPRIDNMVSCAHCGVHLPERDAVERAGHHYCGLPHADAGPRLRGGP